MQTQPRSDVTGCSRAGVQAAPGEGGLLVQGNYWTKGSSESYQLPTRPVARGMNASVVKWGMQVDVARRFHYRVKAGSKEQVPLLPLTISYSQSV